MAGADDLPVLGPAIALAGFTVGAFAAGLALQGRPSAGWDTRVTALLGTGALILLVLTGAVIVTGDSPSATGQVVIATTIAAVMGQQAMVARALAVKDMTTVVVTSTLTSLAGRPGRAGRAGIPDGRLRQRAEPPVRRDPGHLPRRAGRRGAVAAAHRGTLGLAAVLTCAVVIAGHLRLHRDSAEVSHAAESDVGGRAVL